MTMSDERLAIVKWLLEQSQAGAAKATQFEVGSNKRAVYGAGSLALRRAADAITRGEHVQGIEARQGQDPKGLDRHDESPVPQGMHPNNGTTTHHRE